MLDMGAATHCHSIVGKYTKYDEWVMFRPQLKAECFKCRRQYINLRESEHDSTAGKWECYVEE